MPTNIVYKTGQIIRYKDDSVYDFIGKLRDGNGIFYAKIISCKKGNLTIGREYTLWPTPEFATILKTCPSKLTFTAKNRKKITCEVKHVF